jgi:phospholipid/cholesterol/gamma-HCH transport system permease protein
MAGIDPTLRHPERAVHAALEWLDGAWRVIHTSAALLVLVLSPSSYARRFRAAISRQLVTACAPNVLWSSLLSALMSLVIIRIVVVTALSYGLSQYALEMLIRVLVLELIPLAAALFVALRVAVPTPAQITALHAQAPGSVPIHDLARLRETALPVALATMFAVMLLAIVNCVLAAILSYVSVHGPTLGGLPSFTRTVGRVFSPTVSLVFTAKTLLFSLAVGLLPVATVLVDGLRRQPPASVQLRALAWLLFVVLVIEAASLVGNYY